MNRFEQEYKNRLKKEVQIPEGVQSSVQEAFAQIHQRSASTEKPGRKKITVFKRTVIGLASAAAVFGGVFVFGMANPVMAAQIPLIGHIFEQFQQNYSYPGDYQSLAVPLETEKADTEEAKADGTQAAEKENKAVYTKTVNGMTMTLSEMYCDSLAMYLTMTLKSEEAFPRDDILTDENGKVMMNLEMNEKFSFNQEYPQSEQGYLEGNFLDEYTFAGIVRIDYREAAKIVTEEAHQEYNRKYKELQAQGIEPADSDLAMEIQTCEIPEEFTLNLNLSRIVTPRKNPDVWDSGYTEEEMAAMSDEEWRAVMKQQPADWNTYPNKHSDIWWDGAWNFDLDVKIDSSRTKTYELAAPKEGQDGLASLIVSPFEINLTNIREGAASQVDTFPVVLDASGKMLNYGSDGSVMNFSISSADISTLDIYLCDYMEYMDEIKGYKSKENFKEILDERAIYHDRIQTDIK